MNIATPVITASIIPNFPTYIFNPDGSVTPVVKSVVKFQWDFIQHGVGWSLMYAIEGQTNNWIKPDAQFTSRVPPQGGKLISSILLDYREDWETYYSVLPIAILNPKG